jgi:quercetin dioxygenase-like cupin family protein
VELFDFDRDERHITDHGSVGLLATRIAAGDGPVTLIHLKVAPGGTVGTHPATSPQTFLVLSGEGWVAGPDGERTQVTAGQGVCWSAGEVHTAGTETGFAALAVEGTSLGLFAPETPEPSTRISGGLLPGARP